MTEYYLGLLRTKPESLDSYDEISFDGYHRFALVKDTQIIFTESPNGCDFSTHYGVFRNQQGGTLHYCCPWAYRVPLGGRTRVLVEAGKVNRMIELAELVEQGVPVFYGSEDASAFARAT